MRRSGLASLIAFIVVVFALLGAVLAAGWQPLLGLDLQGGVAVVLKPTTPADEEQIQQAVGIIRSRVDAIGVAEPDITTQGGNVVVQLPGVKDRERALELVGTTAELRFRPVLRTFPSPAAIAAAAAAAAAGDPTGTTEVPASTAPGSTEPASTSPASTVPASTAPASTGSPTSQQQSLGRVGTPQVRSASGEYALAAFRQDTTTTTATTASSTPGSTTVSAATDLTATTSDTASPTTMSPATAPSAPVPDLSQLSPDITDRAGDVNEDAVILPEYDRKSGEESFRYALGPTMVTGDALVAEKTNASLNPSGKWFVALTFKDGDENVGAWRRAAVACVSKDPNVCPTGQLAAVLDGVVISAPTVEDTFASTNEAIISGRFSQQDAQDLAQKLRYGALPVEFERQQSQDVSATIGRDALRAGVAAGLIGLAVVALYILLYYRILGMVAIASLALSFGLLWVIISVLGETQGLALSLSGVVGIVVSIGVSIDSNIVYFEHIKDDMVGGRSLRSSSQRAFKGAMSTIIKADLVSLIGAGVLYWLTVGPVKGFALYLGLSTLLDLVASYFFMRPAVAWLSRSRLASLNPKAFGIPAPHVAAMAKAGAGAGA